MAGNTDYFPTRDGDLVAWCRNYKLTIAEKGGALGLSPAEIAEQQQWCDEIEQKIKEMAAMKAAYQSKAEEKKALKKANIKKLRAAIRQIKVKPNYTTGTGKGLDIIGGGKYKPDSSTYKPKFKARINAQHVRLDYVKKGIDGVEVFRRISGHEEYKSIGTDYHSPFIDAKPLKISGVPELRQYKMIAIINDKHFGQVSHQVELPVMF